MSVFPGPRGVIFATHLSTANKLKIKPPWLAAAQMQSEVTIII